MFTHVLFHSWFFVFTEVTNEKALTITVNFSIHFDIFIAALISLFGYVVILALVTKQ